MTISLEEFFKNQIIILGYTHKENHKTAKEFVNINVLDNDKVVIAEQETENKQALNYTNSTYLEGPNLNSKITIITANKINSEISELEKRLKQTYTMLNDQVFDCCSNEDYKFLETAKQNMTARLTTIYESIIKMSKMTMRENEKIFAIVPEPVVEPLAKMTKAYGLTTHTLQNLTTNIEK